jgi:hypothetical protein
VDFSVHPSTSSGRTEKSTSPILFTPFESSQNQAKTKPSIVWANENADGIRSGRRDAIGVSFMLGSILKIIKGNNGFANSSPYACALETVRLKLSLASPETGGLVY